MAQKIQYFDCGVGISSRCVKSETSTAIARDHKGQMIYSSKDNKSVPAMWVIGDEEEKVNCCFACRGELIQQARAAGQFIPMKPLSAHLKEEADKAARQEKGASFLARFGRTHVAPVNDETKVTAS